MPGKRNNITISDIADMTGLSNATVSRIINFSGNVRPETREKVNAAIRSLREDGTYKMSKRLEKPGLRRPILIAGEFRAGVLPPFITGIQDSAATQGHATVLYNTGQKFYLTGFKQLMRDISFAGIIVQNGLRDLDYIRRFSTQMPVVICFEGINDEHISSVAIDDYAAAKSATEYLISIGRKNIGLLNATPGNYFSKHRESGYTAALTEAGLPVLPHRIAYVADLSYELAQNAAESLLAASPGIDAILAINDIFAVSAMKEARKIGAKVPQDIAIVGFDNSDICLMTDPMLTSVNQPSYQMGLQACNLVLERIANPDTPTKHLKFSGELVVRSSTQVF